MSHVAPSTALPNGVHPRRRQVITLFVLLALAVGISAVLIVRSGDSRTAEVQSSAPAQTSGPNEAARGQAAATAAGVTPAPPAGGPNETNRGEAAHSASRGTDAPLNGGPNEGLRGQAANSAAR